LSDPGKQPPQTALPRPQLFRVSALREIIDIIVLIGAIYALVNLSTVRFSVKGSSMEPNFADKQYLVVSRLSYLLGEPEHGDIVVFHYPRNPSEDYIKRIIALPGETVEIRDTFIYVDGEQLDEGYIKAPCVPTLCADLIRELGPDEFWVMGDNRNHSSDSRVFGPVGREHLVGEVLIRYWPPEDWGLVNHINYPDD
jgi:signal peptidase I